VELVEKLGTLSQKVDVDVKEQIANLETNFYERLDDLKTQVEDKVSKSTDEMSGKMDTMNVRIKKVRTHSPARHCRQHLCSTPSFRLASA
jgi:hypothetical protein